MHKIAKGLKKKKKGKKSKHKEEELFKPEELEAYRREHATVGEEASAKNEEWKDFLSLTSGVDDILKKTQDDLDRIKSTSFFQRIPPPSESEKEKQTEPENKVEVRPEEQSAVPKEDDPQQLGIVPVSESETEEEDEDDIFDTTYIDAIAAGEVKLAYIPESPTDKQEGDDPFDTSIAERAILGPAAERKGKKLVPLGAAVEVLTGRVQLPTCATKPVHRRQILKQQDLLLGSFDNSTDLVTTSAAVESPQNVKTLLDDDEIPLPDEPIDLSKTLYIPPPQPVASEEDQTHLAKNLVKEFEDDEDKEFEALAAESLSKGPVGVIASDALSSIVVPVGPVEDAGSWKPFQTEESKAENSYEDDPFDTTFADNILPGKAELKLIERDILDNDIDFDPRAVSDVDSPLKRRIPEYQLNLITPVQRDLLGGSTSDLSKLGDAPIQPIDQDPTPEGIKYCDPFDTSLVDAIKAPGQAELKFLEKELLGDIDDFDHRPSSDVKSKQRTLSRPDVLNVGQSKSVSFSVPNGTNLLDVNDGSKASKPLTPFYVRKSSLPSVEKGTEEEEEEQDPFDTSFVSGLAPGKAELKIIEKELFSTSGGSPVIPEDQDFDPRDESKVAKVTAVEAIKEIVNPKPKTNVLSVAAQSVDLLSASEDISAKVLTPVAPVSKETFSYADPFDTSIATNILPGKAELKLLENELIQPKSTGASEPNKDLLVHNADTIIEKPLSPVLGKKQSVELDNYDPFDTSFASNIQPGKAELKVLESELI